MIQDIYPSKLDNSFKAYKPEDGDILLIFNSEGKTYVGEDAGQMVFATVSAANDFDAFYLFSVDDKKYFLLDNE